MNETVKKILLSISFAKKIYQPFDYVVDSRGWFYLVKAFLPLSGEIIAKAMYYPYKGCLVKCKNSCPQAILCSAQTNTSLGGFFDFSLQQQTIVKCFSRTAQRLPMMVGQVNVLVNHIATTLEKFGAKSYLFGSRALGIHTDKSDWDILILSTKSPDDLLKHLLLTFDNTIRFFSPEECQQRAHRYATQPNGMDYDALSEIFQYSTTYLKSGDIEIGLFFSPPKCKPLPFELGNFINDKLFSLRAYPVDSGGTSYHLPRRICVKDKNGQIHIIYSVIWELGGIERARPLLLEFAGLRKIGSHIWWMGGEKANIRLIS